MGIVVFWRSSSGRDKTINTVLYRDNESIFPDPFLLPCIAAGLPRLRGLAFTQKKRGLIPGGKEARARFNLD
jgi:hypothetical protein